MPNIRLPAKITSLEKLVRFVSDFAKGEGFTQKRIQQIELATEEALVNIFDYAYPDENIGDVEVRCKMDVNTGLIIEILDNGIPFDIKSFSKPDLCANISDRKIGGLGIYLIKQMVNRVHSRREGQSNILTLVIDRKS
jgi:serine/threonine-protein kinase RsbW